MAKKQNESASADIEKLTLSDEAKGIFEDFRNDMDSYEKNKGGLPLISEYSAKTAEAYDRETASKEWPKQFHGLLAQDSQTYSRIPEAWREGKTSHSRFLQAAAVGAKMDDLIKVCEAAAAKIAKDLNTRCVMNDVRQKGLSMIWKGIQNGKSLSDVWSESIATNAGNYKATKGSMFDEVKQAKNKLAGNAQQKVEHSAGARALAAVNAIRAVFMSKGELPAIRITDEEVYKAIVTAQKALVAIGMQDGSSTKKNFINPDDVEKKFALPTDPTDDSSYFNSAAAKEVLKAKDWKEVKAEDPKPKAKAKVKVKDKNKGTTLVLSDDEEEWLMDFRRRWRNKK